MTKPINPLDFGPAATAHPYCWICTDCTREELSADPSLPQGWDKIDGTSYSRPTVIRCPDCAEMVEREHIARRQQNIADMQAAADSLAVNRTARTDNSTVNMAAPSPAKSFCGLDIAMPDKDSIAVAVQMGEPRAFSLMLSRQHDGSYRVAMTPEQVLMLFTPQSFLLTAQDARDLASDLYAFAQMASQPGTLSSTERASA